MKLHSETLEEANLLFEMIKTMLITWLSQTQITQFLRRYTHYEIRNGRYVNWKFVVEDLVSFNLPD